MPLTDITGMQIWWFIELKNTGIFFLNPNGDRLKLTFGNVILNAMWWRCLIWRGTYLKVNILLLFSRRTLSRRILGSSQATTRVVAYQMDMFAIWRARGAPYRWPQLPFCFCPAKVSVINVTLSQQVCRDGGPCRTQGVTNPALFPPIYLNNGPLGRLDIQC